MQDDERWLPIPGWEGLYEVSDQGRVRSVDRLDPSGRNRKSCLLKQRVDTVGYLVVNLCRGSGPVTQRVHRLVALAFHANPLGLRVVMHADNDKQNNSASNLSWGTHRDNSLQSYQDGRLMPPTPRAGSASPNAKMNEMQVRVVRRCRERGVKLRELADIFGVSVSTVSTAASGVWWKHVRHSSEEVAA